MSGHRPTKVLTDSRFSRGQIANVLRMTGVESGVTRVSYSSDGMPGLAWSLVDTGDLLLDWKTTGDEVIHILHVMDEPGCRIMIDGLSMPIAPGDTVRIGSPSAVQLSDGILMLQVRCEGGGPSSNERPSHGSEQFDGYNRQTNYDTGSEIGFGRWKLTVPLDLEIASTSAFVVLFGNVSIIHSGSIQTLGPGESVVYAGDLLKIVPDGLAYVATIQRSE